MQQQGYHTSAPNLNNNSKLKSYLNIDQYENEDKNLYKRKENWKQNFFNLYKKNQSNKNFFISESFFFENLIKNSPKIIKLALEEFNEKLRILITKIFLERIIYLNIIGNKFTLSKYKDEKDLINELSKTSEIVMKRINYLGKSCVERDYQSFWDSLPQDIRNIPEAKKEIAMVKSSWEEINSLNSDIYNDLELSINAKFQREKETLIKMIQEQKLLKEKNEFINFTTLNDQIKELKLKIEESEKIRIEQKFTIEKIINEKDKLEKEIEKDFIKKFNNKKMKYENEIKELRKSLKESEEKNKIRNNSSYFYQNSNSYSNDYKDYIDCKDSKKIEPDIDNYARGNFMNQIQKNKTKTPKIERQEMLNSCIRWKEKDLEDLKIPKSTYTI